MKKVFFITIGSLFLITMASAQTIAAVTPISEETEIKTSKKSINDVRAIDEIRNHLLSDIELRHVFDAYVESGQLKAEITIDRNGLIQDVKIIEGLSRTHNQEIMKSIRKIKRVSPIKIDGKVVRQKVVLPIYFQ